MVITKAQKAAQQNSTTSKLPASAPQAKATSAAASMEAASDAAAEEGSSTDVISAIHAMQIDFSKKFEDVLSGISGIKNELQRQANRITEAEDRIGQAEDSLKRRNNLRLIGLPEKAEGNDMCAFLEKWLITALGTDTFPTPPIIERAHRIGRLSAGQDPKPRAVIIRFLNYREKESAVRAARRQNTVKFENHSVRFYPDYSVETHRQQRLFDPVKRQLQSLGLRYGMFYPAILAVTHNGQRHPFTKVHDTEKFVQRVQGDTSNASAPKDK